MISLRTSKLKSNEKRKKLETTPNKINKGSHSYCPICSSDEVYLISEVDRVGFPCDTVVCKKCEFERKLTKKKQKTHKSQNKYFFLCFCKKKKHKNYVF